jgi:hypothetical protein
VEGDDEEEGVVDTEEEEREKGREGFFLGISCSDSVVNADGEGGRISTFSEESDFGWGEGVRRVNNEPVETSWEFDLG